MTTPRYALLAAGQIHERHRAARIAFSMQYAISCGYEKRPRRG